jgi:NAD(P)-dependent dehydrogenase (short-subunit alcohol dehydrogenase family)
MGDKSVPDLLRLDGKVAVVSGASRNIGLEASRAMAEVGAHVVMLARDAGRLHAVAAEIAERTGGTVTPRACDVSSEEDAGALLEWLGAEFGQVDVLLNNAYAIGTRTAPVLSITPEDWTATLSTNLLGPYRLCAGLIPAMMAGHGGSVINMLSGAAFRPNGTVLAYGATKAALWSMTQYLAHFCAPKVRVNALVPGLVQNKDGGEVNDDDVLPRYLPEIPMGRPGRPEEIAPAIVYLASDASSYTTGSIMWVNGGRPT